MVIGKKRCLLITLICAGLLSAANTHADGVTQAVNWSKRWRDTTEFALNPSKTEALDANGDRWSISTGAFLGSFEWGSSFRPFTFSPDGSEVARGEGTTLRIYSYPAGTLLKEILNSAFVSRIEYAPDGNRLLVTYQGSNNDEVMYNRNGSPLIDFTISQSLGPIAFSPDGSEYASISSSGVLSRYNSANGSIIESVITNVPGVLYFDDIVYLQNGDVLAVGLLEYYDEFVNDYLVFPYLYYFDIGSFSSLAWVNDCAQVLALGPSNISVNPSEDGFLISAYAELQLFEGPACSDSSGLFYNINEPLWGLWLSDSQIATNLGIYDTNETLVQTFPGPIFLEAVSGLTGLIRNNSLYSTSGAILDLSTGNEIAAVTLQSFGGIALNEPATLYANSTSNGDVEIRRTSDGGLEQTLSGHSQSVSALRFLGDQQRLLSGSFDDSVRLWDLETGDDIVFPPMHSAYIRNVDVSQDGLRAVSASQDGVIHVWDISDLENIQVIQTLNVPSVDQVLMTPDGASVITEDFSAGISRWDVATGLPAYTVLASAGAQNLDLSPDGSIFLAEERDRLSIWRTADGQLVNEILESVGGDGTDAFFAGDGSIIRRSQRALSSLDFPHVFVNPLATPGGDGCTWATAFDSVEAALSYLSANNKVADLWLASGTYMPVTLTDPEDPRSATYVIPDGVRLVGGFAGTEARLSERDPVANPTLLTQNPMSSRTLLSPVGKATLDGLTIVRGSNPPLATEEFRLVNDGRLTFRNCRIQTDADGFIGLDPDPSNLADIMLESTPIEIVVEADAFCGKAGELLELRTPDVLCGTAFNPDCLSGLIDAAGAPVFSGTPEVRWIINKLEVKSGTTLNLTNRPNFDFRDVGDTIPECLYVRELIIESGARINTGLLTVYYETLTDAGDVSNVPLLGFSLINIDMECQEEFDARVSPRLRDDNDTQPVAPPFLEGSIQRTNGALAGDPSRFYMEMKTQDDANGSDSASTISAKATFARAGEDEILVAFEYTFCGNPTDELVVYLSDAPEVGQNLVEIARITPPTSGPGSISSDQFATFSGLFPRGSLNFRRGTYVELELVGQDACVLIDEWDPLVCFSQECGDFSGDNATTNIDLLYGLSALGETVLGVPESIIGANSCLDKVNRDNYVDISDVVIADSLYDYGVVGLCDGAGSSSFAGMTSGVVTPEDQLIIAGKSNVGGDLGDRLYPVDEALSISGLGIAPPVAAGGMTYGVRGHGRLVKDGSGALYQLHSVAGLVRLSDGQVMVAPGDQSFNGNTVRLGMPSTGDGLPIFDAAFDPNDPTTVYVVPARVIPGGDEDAAYYVAAQLSLAENAGVVTWTIQETYGFDPQTDPNNNTQPPQFSQTNVQYLREIETDSDGNVYVTCARADNQNDWLLIYDAVGGTASEQRVRLSDLPAPLRGPAALHVSDDGSKLYLGTSLDEGDPATTKVQEFTLGGMSGAITVTPSRVIEIGNMRFVTSIAEDTNGTEYVVGYTAPVQDPFSIFFFESDSLFTTPTLATLPPTGTTTTATTITGADAALPLSAVFSSSNTSSCLPGDIDNSGAVNNDDIASFVDVLLNGTVDPDQACRADVNQDGTSDGRDVGMLVDLITGQ